MFFAVRFISCIPLVAAVQLSVHVYFNKFLQQSEQCKMKTSRQTVRGHRGFLLEVQSHAGMFSPLVANPT